jgi:hypothetical protein
MQKNSAEPKYVGYERISRNTILDGYPDLPTYTVHESANKAKMASF